MKLPAWLENELEEVGRKVLSGETAHKAAAGILADQIAGDERFTHAVAAAFARTQLRGWIRSHGHGWQLADGTGDPGAQLELFTWLPPFLETSPGRFARVDTMTGEDWDAALRQAEVKAGNAQNYAQVIRRAHDRVRPLLTDDTMTTADVAGQLT